MIRKILTILLTLHFLILSVGISKNLHFCQDRLKEVSFFVAFENINSCCENAEMPEGCCTSESSFIHLEGDFHQESSVVQIPDLSILEYLPSFIYVLSSYINLEEHTNLEFSVYTPPLLYEKQPVYIFNQSFLI